MRVLRRLLLPVLASGAILLAACGSSAPPSSNFKQPGIGATLSQVQKFFESHGGGHWQQGAITGGLVGYAVYGGPGKGCPVSLNGTTDNIVSVDLFCYFNGAVVSNPQQARSIITATVDRYAPKASGWIRTELDTALAPNNTTAMNVTKKAGGRQVQFQRERGVSGNLNLLVEPIVTGLAPTTSTTTAPTTSSTS